MGGRNQLGNPAPGCCQAGLKNKVGWWRKGRVVLGREGRAGGGGQEAQGMHPVQVPYHPSGREFQNVNMKGIYIHYVQHEMTYIYI